MDGLLPTSQPIQNSGRLSSDHGSLHARRLSSISSRAEDKLDEQNDAGRQSYEYIRMKQSGKKFKNPRISVFNDVVETAPWKCGEKYQYGSVEAAGSWQKCHRLVKKYDNDICDAWREEVDKLLIFAGLFSATVTAFTVESYQWLQPSSQDATSQFLAFLASEYAQNHNTSLPPSLLSLTQHQQLLQPSSLNPSSATIRINTFWFLSLTLSLTTVLIGILCLQWLREFQRDASLPHKDALSLRQMRFQGLVSWHVPTILSTLPLLLQLSLLLFFAGLLDLLWDRNRGVVAAVVTVTVGFVVMFLGATTALPAFQFALVKDEFLLKGVHQCPYKSPQSWLFLRITQWTARVTQVVCTWWTRESFDWPIFHRLLKSSVSDLNWSMLDMRWRSHRDACTIVWGTPKDRKDAEDIVGGMEWVNDTFSQSPDAVFPIYHCLADLDIPAASELIGRLYRGSPFEESTFRVMMNDRFSPDITQKREIVSTFFLHLHQEQHPVMKPLYIESVVRILNTQEVPAPFLDWLSTMLQEITSGVIVSRQQQQQSSAPGVGARVVVKGGIADPQILRQMISCTSKQFTNTRNTRRPNIDIINTWILLDTLLWGPHHHHHHHQETITPPSILGSTVAPNTVANTIDTINAQHLTLASTFFQDIQVWITRNTRDIELRERVEICMQGLLLVFPDHFSEGFEEGVVMLGQRFVEFRKSVGELVKLLDGMVDGVGGDSASTGEYGLGFNSWPRGYDGGGGSISLERWKRLVAMFV